MVTSADIGIIGLGVMGKNIALNFSDHGYIVSLYNRTREKAENFVKENPKRKFLLGTDFKDFIEKLKSPRVILLILTAGDAVDEVINKILPYLQPKDIVIDGGNSHFSDTERRYKTMKEKNIFFVGCGISGGAAGARFGPSLMPGGNRDAWPHIEQMFFSIAAKARNKLPCCAWMGEGGAGHYVKMAHNAIEYADMQLIAEIYDVLRRGIGYSFEECRLIFEEWNRTDLNSYLLEITAKILKEKEEDGSYILDHILDISHAKKTGAWACADALLKNVPLTMSTEAVYARFVSEMKEERVNIAKYIKGPRYQFKEDKKHFVHELSHALYGSRIINLQQGFRLIRQASRAYNWHIPLSQVAFVWTEGCIIRSRLLSHMQSSLENVDAIFEDGFFQNELMRLQSAWRSSIVHAVLMGTPVPTLSSALAYFDAYRTADSNASLIAAMRDFFGQHGFERVEEKTGELRYHKWKK